MSQPARTLCFAALLPLLVAVLSGCTNPAAQPPQLPPPVVTVSPPLVEDVTDSEPFTGRMDAVEAVEIRARVSGYLDKVLFEPGSEVEKDDPLFVIDPRPYKAELDRAEGQVGVSQARFERLSRDAERAQRSGIGKAVSREEYDKIIGDRLEADAATKAGKANIEKQKLDLSFTEVKAPISGKISRNLITVGNLVTTDSTLLTTIVSVDPMDAYFDVNERTMLRIQRLIREGKMKAARETEVPLYLGLATDVGYPHKGKVDFVDNKVDPGTGTLKVRGVFPNPLVKGNTRVLYPGLFVRIQLPIGDAHKALLVPERALGTDQGKKFLYIVNEKNEVVYRPVQLGALHPKGREILEGVKAGERVIVNGLQRVRPGITVDPKSEAPATAVAKGNESAPLQK